MLDEELRVLRDGPVAGFTADGVYRLTGTVLEVIGWEDGAVRYVVPLESEPSAPWPVDGAVAASGVDNPDVYR